MKKQFLYFLFATVLFHACTKDDNHVFDKSPDQRLNETIAAFQAQLQNAQYGWRGMVYPKAGGAYTFYFKFSNANRVNMLSSFDSASAVTLKESSYRLKALQQPSLVFDTYSYLHVLSDPDPNVNGGTVGAGLQSDFEFYFDSSSTDTINLVGRVNGSKAVLVRATQTEANAFAAGQLASGLLINKIQTYYKRLTVGNASLDIYFDAGSRSITWTDNNGNLLDTTRMSEYYLTLGGIGFSKPFTLGNQKISQMNNVTFNATTQTVIGTINNLNATVTEVIDPLKVDVAAPSRWWNEAASTNDYWFSINGFHVNGVEDAFDINNLTSGTFPYYFLIYWPKYNAQNDLFAPVFLDAAANSLTIEYATAPRVPTYSSDGKAFFRQFGNFGNYPTTGAAGNSRNLLYSTAGFYFVQTSESSYDMVSAIDGKAWITWYSSK